MSLIIGLIFLAIILTLALLRGKKIVPVLEQKMAENFKGVFAHPNHTWVEAIQPDLAYVGTDEFTKSVFGSVEKFELPEKGDIIVQGGKAWSLKRGERELTQRAPVSGEVVEINPELLKNPKALFQKETWILKIQPTKLRQELKNLLHGNLLRRWNQAVKEQLIATFTTSEFPVLQEGGEVKPGLGDELTSEQWNKVRKEFFDVDCEKEINKL